METLVQAGVTGSVLGDLLLIPGLSMVRSIEFFFLSYACSSCFVMVDTQLAGGIKYKEQRFSPAVAGVSSVLLIIAIIGTVAGL